MISPRLLLFLPGLALAAPESYPAENGLTRTLVAKEPLLKNPVSVAVDVDGTVYVTETARRKVADLDIREAPPAWIPEDLSHSTIEDKLAFYQRELVPGRFDKHPSLKDWNKDGAVDIKDLTVISEKIIKFTDTDGDGVMDASNVFAEGFNTPVTGIAAGVFAWRGDVYTTIAPDVWKLRDTDGDGKADQRESIAHGFGIHIAYAGHDMHGLTWGPDGRLYWSIGDKGTNVMSKEGKRWEAPFEGAVLRCYPDGSGFEIFARGLRNCQEIAFDDYGNLFGVDNDADIKGESERFVYITPGSDSGWRCYYQYRKSDYNPWMAESIFLPSGPDQPAYITPALAAYGDGPAGFAYNPGTALNERYKGSFFVSEFPKGEVHSFKTEENGAAFKMTDEHVVLSGPMNVGMNFGPDGALYTADWAGGYPLKEKGSVWKVDDPAQTNSPLRKEVAAFLKQGPAEISTPELIARLAHADQRIRLDAQWELAKRKAVPELKALAGNPASTRIAVIHALWGLAQTKTFDPEIFALLLKGSDAELRAQAAKWAGEISPAPQPALVPLLADPSLRVRSFAANAIGAMHMTEALDAVVKMLEDNANQDAYIRQAGVIALGGMDIEKVAAATLKHSSASVRLTAAVVFRRASSPHAADLLGDADLKVAAEAARAIYDSPTIPSAYPALAKLIESNPAADGPAIRRSISINRRIADKASALRLIQFAATKTAPPALRSAALEALASWNRKLDLDPVDGRYDPIEAADPAVAKEAFAKISTDLQHEDSDAVAIAASAAAGTFGIAAKPDALAKDTTDKSAKPSARIRALRLLQPADAKTFRATAIALLTDDSPAIRSVAAALLAEKSPDQALKYLQTAAVDSKDIGERQSAIDTLGKIPGEASAKFLTGLFEAVPAKSDLPTLLNLLGTTKDRKDLKSAADQATARLKDGVKTLPLLEGGDAALGAKVFNENLASQCLACHRIGPQGSSVGPPLTTVGTHAREYLLESLLDPGAKLAPGFGLTSATLKDGKTVSGSLKSESADSVTITLPDGTDQSIALADITARTPAVSVMPPMGAILSPRELRDLVEYLTTLK